MGVGSVEGNLTKETILFIIALHLFILGRLGRNS